MVALPPPFEASGGSYVHRVTDRQTAPRGGNALVTKRDHMRGESILNVTLKPLENNPKNLGTTGT